MIWGRKRAGLKDERIHALRHSLPSSAMSTGQSLPIIGALLGHTQVQTTARPVHLAAAPVRTAAEEVTLRIADILDG